MKLYADRVLSEREVVRVIDRHTDENGTLDNDITCILEEVTPVVFAGSKKSLENLTDDREYRKSIRNNTIDEFAKLVFTIKAEIGNNDMEFFRNIIKEVVRKMKEE